tara:strand:+ start:2815 stop:3795 length:981 start_codon:yes stop_codon:yes gene_type:complete
MINKVVVVGLGSIAKRHRQNIKELFPNAIVYAIPSSARKVTTSVDFCDEIVNDINELKVKDFQLAIIASPSSFHAKHSIPFIESNVPTIIEKPIAATASDAYKIIDSQLKYETKVGVGYCLRFLPSFQCFRNLLQANKVGDIQSVFIEVGQYLPDWRSDKNYKKSVSASKELGGGALLELSHEVDYAFNLFGELELQYGCQQASSELGLEVEDCVDLVATTKHHIPVNIHLDFLQKKPARFCKVVGSKGVMQLDFINNEITFTDSHLTEKLFSEPSWDKNLMYINMLKQFLSLDNEIDTPVASIEDSAQVVQFIDFIKSSCVLIKR